MDTRKRGTTTEMQVTSIRLEPELKERLREISGEQGYQTLIRDVLWQFVEQQMISDEKRSPSLENTQLPSQPPLLPRSEIRTTFEAIAQQAERCAVTGQSIRPQQRIWLGLTLSGDIVPLSIEITGLA